MTAITLLPSNIRMYVCIISDSVHERHIDMTEAKMYWRQVLKDYNITKLMALPIDREHPSNGIYSGQGFSTEIHFTDHIVKQLVDYASHFNVTLYQVCLSIYYVFLFKLTGGQRDLIIGTLQANRYRPELRYLIGMFVNTIPMRIYVDPQDTFEQLLHKVSTMLFEVQPYSNLPYQDIIKQLSMNQLHESNLIQTLFTLNENTSIPVHLGPTSVIEPYSIRCLNDNVSQNGMPISAVAMFDLELSIEYIAELNSLRAQLIASSDIFDASTVVRMAQQFQLIVEQLFSSASMVMIVTRQSIYDLSLISSQEIAEDLLYLQSDTIKTTNLIGNRYLGMIIAFICLFLF